MSWKPFPAQRRELNGEIFQEMFQHGKNRLLPRFFFSPPNPPANVAVEEEYHVYDILSELLAWTDSVGSLLTVLRLLNLSERNNITLGIVRGNGVAAVIFDNIPAYRIAKRYLERALALAHASGQSFALGTAYYCLAFHEVLIGDLGSALEHGRITADAFEEDGNLHNWGLAGLLIAQSLLYLGKLDDCFKHGVLLVQMGQLRNSLDLEKWGEMMQGLAQRRMRELEKARAHLERAIEIATLVSDPYVGVLASGELGQCYLQMGEMARAIAVLEAGERMRSQYTAGVNASTHLLHGQIEFYLFQAEQASHSEKEVWLKIAAKACASALKRINAFHPSAPVTMLLKGRLEWLLGKPDLARKWWKKSLSEARRMRMRYDEAMVLLEISERLGESGHLDLADSILTEIRGERSLA